MTRSTTEHNSNATIYFAASGAAYQTLAFTSDASLARLAGAIDAGPVYVALPEIRLGTDELRVNDEAIAALAARDGLYHRGGALVEVREPPGRPRGITRPARRSPDSSATRLPPPWHV